MERISRICSQRVMSSRAPRRRSQEEPGIRQKSTWTPQSSLIGGWGSNRRVMWRRRTGSHLFWPGLFSVCVRAGTDRMEDWAWVAVLFRYSDATWAFCLIVMTTWDSAAFRWLFFERRASASTSNTHTAFTHYTRLQLPVGLWGVFRKQWHRLYRLRPLRAVNVSPASAEAPPSVWKRCFLLSLLASNTHTHTHFSLYVRC